MAAASRPKLDLVAEKMLGAAAEVGGYVGDGSTPESPRTAALAIADNEYNAYVRDAREAMMTPGSMPGVIDPELVGIKGGPGYHVTYDDDWSGIDWNRLQRSNVVNRNRGIASVVNSAGRGDFPLGDSDLSGKNISIPSQYLNSATFKINRGQTTFYRFG